MSFLFGAPNHAYEVALRAFEHNRGALILMRKKLLIRKNFSATFVSMDALELDLRQEISRHAVDSIKLTLLAAVRTSVRVLLEPLILAITAQRLLASFALDWVFENIVADSADKLAEKCLNLSLVEDKFLFVNVLGVNFAFINQTFHTFHIII